VGVSKIANPNKIKGWDYLGSTTADAHITIPDKYTDVQCMAYVENNINQVIAFSINVNYVDARTYRQGYYYNSSENYCASIHNDTSGGWWGWSVGKNGTSVINTTNFYWFAR
jgi:hypothetical protein